MCFDCTNALPLQAVGSVAETLVRVLVVASLHPLPEMLPAHHGAALSTCFLRKEARIGEAK